MLYTRIITAVLATICFMFVSVQETSGYRNDPALKIIWSIGIILASFTVLSLLISNRNEWIFAKISACILAWFIASLVDTYGRQTFADYVILTVLVILLGASFSYATGYEHPTIGINKLMKSTELARINEVHATTNGEDAFFSDDILVLRDGDIYYYAYCTENGNIARGYLPVDKTEIIHYEDETPRLDEYCLEKHWYARQNNQLVEHTSLHETWYELHLPTDAVVVSFQPLIS